MNFKYAKKHIQLCLALLELIYNDFETRVHERVLIFDPNCWRSRFTRDGYVQNIQIF